VRSENISEVSEQLWLYVGLVVVLIYIVNALLMGCLFAKSRQKVWQAWLPFWNIWQFLKLGSVRGVNCLWFVGAGISFTLGYASDNIELRQVLQTIITPCLLAVFFATIVWAGLNIQAKLAKPQIFIALMLVNFLAPLWLWILALDNSKWQAKKPRPKTAGMKK
jgi:hypothetical protein